MATEGGLAFDDTLIANADLSAKQYYIVMSTGQNTAALCTGSSGGASRPVGVLQNDPPSGAAATVRFYGYTKVSAGSTIAAGEQITSTTGGQAMTAVTTGALVIGRANTNSTASGQIIEAFLFGPYFFTAGATA